MVAIHITAKANGCCSRASLLWRSRMMLISDEFFSHPNPSIVKIIINNTNNNNKQVEGGSAVIIFKVSLWPKKVNLTFRDYRDELPYIGYLSPIGVFNHLKTIELVCGFGNSKLVTCLTLENIVLL